MQLMRKRDASDNDVSPTIPQIRMAQNVKVAIRVRNVPKWFGTDGTKDSAEYQTPIVLVDTPNPTNKINQHLVIGSESLQKEKREFSYDYVFSPDDGQAFIYDNLISPLIAKCVQGFNGCVFVYGQTASGKTYTMGGPAVQNQNDRGIIIRVAEHLCDYIDKNGRKDLGKAGLDFHVTGSYLEIYNEQLKDLLGKNNEELKIRLDPTSISGKDVYVQGLTQVPLTKEADYIEAIAMGVTKRRVAETNMNAVSSRSHSIFTLNLIQREYLEGGKEGIKRKSKIHLIDLAGSERAESTGATGQTLKEGAAINQSLSCLGNVINALSIGSNHVPYRDSKLTHLLSDSLGGNSLTILVACLTPIAGAYEETVSTLKFAERVKKIKNKAILNVDANTLRTMALEAENAELKEKLSKCTCGKPALNVPDQSSALKEKLAFKLKAIFDPAKHNKAGSERKHASLENGTKVGDVISIWKRKSHAKVDPNNSQNILPDSFKDNTKDQFVVEREAERKELLQEIIVLKSKKAELSQKSRELELMIEQEEANKIQKLSEIANGSDKEYQRLRAEYDDKHRSLLLEKENVEKELSRVKKQLMEKDNTEIKILMTAKGDENQNDNTDNRLNEEVEEQRGQQNEQEMDEYYQQMLRRALDMPSTTQTFLNNPNEPNDLSEYKPFMQHSLYQGDDDYYNENHHRGELKYKLLMFLAPLLGMAIGFGLGWLGNAKLHDPPNRNSCTPNSSTSISSSLSNLTDVLVTTNLIAGTPNSHGFLNGQGSLSKFARLRGIAVNSTGHLFVIDETNQNIRLLSPPSWSVTTFAGSNSLEFGLRNGPVQNSLFSSPRDIFIDRQGTIWIADCGNSLVRKIDSAGIVSTFYNTGGCPVGIAINPKTDHVYVADSKVNMIFHLLPSGQLSSLIGTGQHGKRDGIGATASFSTVNHLAIDSQGENLYVADCGGCQTTSNNPGTNSLIRKVVLSSEIVSTLSNSSSFCGPNYLAVSPSTGNLLVTQDCPNYNTQVSHVRYVLVDGGEDGIFASNSELLPGFGVAFGALQNGFICSDTAIYSISA